MKLPTFAARQSMRSSQVLSLGEPTPGPWIYRTPAPLLGIAPQACSCGGQEEICTCGPAANASFLFAFGSVYATFPSLSIEKEFYQVARPEELGLPKNQFIFTILRQTQHLYLAREICWTLRLDNIDVYVLYPSSLVELMNLIAAIGPSSADDVTFDVIVGQSGPVSSPDQCNGLQVPTVSCTQIFDISQQEITRLIQAETGANADQALATFVPLISLTYNTGATDEYRAINFLVLKYFGIYQTTYTLLAAGWSLLSVNTAPSRVQGTRKILDVIFTYQNDTSGVLQRWYCRVDVTGESPYLALGMTRYYVQS